MTEKEKDKEMIRLAKEYEKIPGQGILFST